MSISERRREIRRRRQRREKRLREELKQAGQRRQGQADPKVDKKAPAAEEKTVVRKKKGE